MDRANRDAAGTLAKRIEQALSANEGLKDALLDVLDPEEVTPWLQEPKEIFQNHSPLELIEDGRVQQIYLALEFLTTGSAF